MCKMNKMIGMYLMIVGTIVAVSGLVFTILPHSAHYAITKLLAIGNYEISHEQHQIIGETLVFVGIALSFIGGASKKYNDGRAKA